MDIIIKNELDPVFEILNLLTTCHTDNLQEQTIQALTDYGVDGEAFARKHLPVVIKYMKTFQEHKVTGSQESLFFNKLDKETFFLVITMVAENRCYLDNSVSTDIMKLRSLLAYYITDYDGDAVLPDVTDMPRLADEKAMIEFLDTADVKDEEKWYILDLLRKPDYWLKELWELIQINIPAYEAALAAVEKPLKKLLKRVSAYRDENFTKIARTCSRKPVIYPSLAMPLMQLIMYTHGYYGLLVEDLVKFEATTDAARETIIRQVKTISDKSKLDILSSLKVSNKYNLELAEALELSPSTTSHHMSVLLSNGFVTVEKRDGKVYYCLHKKNIQNFLNTLTDILT